MSRQVVQFAGIALVIGAIAIYWFSHRAPEVRLSTMAAEPSSADPSGTERSDVRKSPVSTSRHRAVSNEPDGESSSGVTAASVLRIVEPDANTTFSQRLEAVHALSRHMTEEEIQALYWYLQSAARFGDVSDRSEAFLRNDIMNKLAEQETVPAGYAALLIQIYNGRMQQYVMRDYAVQHLSAVFPRLSRDDQQRATGAFWRAAEEVDSGIAGTAMLALSKITESAEVAASASAGGEHRNLARTILAVVDDQNSGELARITAASLCGRWGLEQAVPTLTAIAKTAESIPLRTAAVAALGDLGTVDAEAVLHDLSRNGHARLQIPIQSALARLKKQL